MRNKPQYLQELSFGLNLFSSFRQVIFFVCAHMKLIQTQTAVN